MPTKIDLKEIRETKKKLEDKIIQIKIGRALKEGQLKQFLLGLEPYIGEAIEKGITSDEGIANYLNEKYADRIGKEVSPTDVAVVKQWNVDETSRATYNMTRLLEAELEQATLILAVKDINSSLQDMAETLAKMNAEDVMPLIDQLKATFGPEKAEAFNRAATEALNSALEAVKKSKDAIGNQQLSLEGKAVAPDMTDMGMHDMTAPAPTGDMFAAADASSGPVDEPLGRSKKEGVEPKKSSLTECKVGDTVKTPKGSGKVTKVVQNKSVTVDLKGKEQTFKWDDVEPPKEDKVKEATDAGNINRAQLPSGEYMENESDKNEPEKLGKGTGDYAGGPGKDTVGAYTARKKKVGEATDKGNINRAQLPTGDYGEHNSDKNEPEKMGKGTGDYGKGSGEDKEGVYAARKKSMEGKVAQLEKKMLAEVKNIDSLYEKANKLEKKFIGFGPLVEKLTVGGARAPRALAAYLGLMKLVEKWGTKMHTKEKDKGMWKGKSMAKLKKTQSSLRKKKTRSAADSKRLKQVNFAIRAKKAGGKKWKGVKAESVSEATVAEKSPKGWSGTVKAMKGHKEIDNPFALAHSMEKKGYKPHYPEESVEESDPSKKKS